MKAARTLSERSSASSAALPPPVNSAESAKAAGLRYVTDDTPGFRRRRSGNGFIYISLEGRVIRDPGELRRIKSLAIPPAWRDVWICPLANGHLQATGRDAKGRKQHRYHPGWREVRDRTKYDKMLAFAKQLPAIRRQVRKDLALPGLPRRKVLATVVRLLETGMVRIGNQEYARRNKSFGLATLRSRHVNVAGPRIKFEFRGKSGVQHAFDVRDRRLAKIIQDCQELPGHELFQYIDEHDERCAIGSADVNDYLRAIAGNDFSSKDFRTWAGTVLAVATLVESRRAARKPTKKSANQAIRTVAKQLGNTAAVCRKCYIHPLVFEAHMDGSLFDAFDRDNGKAKASIGGNLKRHEAALVALLKKSRKQNGSGVDKDLRRQLRKSVQRAKAAELKVV